MGIIENLREIRRDGNVIDESTPLGEITRRGWKPDRVVSVSWTNGDREISSFHPFGCLVELTRDRRSLALLERSDEHADFRTLKIIDPEGSVRFLVENEIAISSVMKSGKFCWFEPPHSKTTNLVGVVFQVDSDDSMYQLDVDVDIGKVVDVFETR